MGAQTSTSATPVDPSIGVPNSAASEELFTIFNELSEEFVTFMIGLFTILAVKTTEIGNALSVKHNGFLMAAVLVAFVKLLGTVLATVLQLNAKTRSLNVKLLFGSSVSILVSFIISSATGWLTLSLWLCVFAVLAVVNMKNIVKLVSSIVG